MQEPMNEGGGELPEELKAFESRLAGVRPAAAGIDRDRMLFEAGRAAGLSGAKRARWVWGAGTFGGWAAAACVALVLWPHAPKATPGNSSEARGPGGDVGAPQNVQAVENAPRAGDSVLAGLLSNFLPQPSPALRERNLILSRGADALPDLPPSTGIPAADPLPESYQLHPLLGHAKGFRS